MSKLLVVFVFHELNDRVKSFIKNALFYDVNVDFFIVINNKTIIFDAPSYCKVLFRDNIGYDFGGWSEALLTNSIYKLYDKFIFVNSSVIGPFLPSYYKGRWTDVYLDGLEGNVKLFGSTINTCGNPLAVSHVQSYIFAMDKNTLEYLIDCEIFSITKYAKTFGEAIWHKEVRMSVKILENGWNIGSLLPYYSGVDFTFQQKRPEDYPIKFLDDPMYPTFRPHMWNEHQLVFIKGNRVPIPL